MNLSALDLSVIVRTSGRSTMFLRRALQSIAAQTRPPAAIYVVNDGESPSAVELELAKFDLRTIKLVHLARDLNKQPLPNRATALNRGIAVASTKWLAILDDDDTWSPQFIERMGAVIQKQGLRPSFGGVVSQTEAIYERLKKDRISEVRRMPFNPTLKAVDLAALAVETQFTINAMVVAKTVYDSVGGYREDLPVQEDWEFNVRAAANFEFDVIPEALAHYHLRPSDSESANSSVEELNCVAARIRNEWLRADIAAGRIGLGQLTLAGETRGLSRELSRWVRWRKRIYKFFGRNAS